MLTQYLNPIICGTLRTSIMQGPLVNFRIYLKIQYNGYDGRLPSIRSEFDSRVAHNIFLLLYALVNHFVLICYTLTLCDRPGDCVCNSHIVHFPDHTNICLIYLHTKYRLPIFSLRAPWLITYLTVLSDVLNVATVYPSCDRRSRTLQRALL